MGPDVIVFFEPNIDCDLGLFDAVWDRSLSTFNSASSSQYVLTISDFEP